MNPADSVFFILASASPRRRELLQRAGYRFEVIPSQVDESLIEISGLSPEECVNKLAFAKAKDVARGNPEAYVLGADTVVDYQGQIIGKPTDAVDAERITRILFAGPHKVTTGVALICLEQNRQVVFSDTTIVYPAQLSEQQITEHIQSGNWRGKAGAYGIQETGDTFVDYIDGSFTNVMGLPMERIAELLDSLKSEKSD